MTRTITKNVIASTEETAAITSAGLEALAIQFELVQHAARSIYVLALEIQDVATLRELARIQSLMHTGELERVKRALVRSRIRSTQIPQASAGIVPEIALDKVVIV